MDRKCLHFEGCNFFRQRLVLATLSSRAIRITTIREHSDEPGLREFEAGFIRLLDKLTNGSKIEINETGTTLFYQPGLLIGGSLEHECSRQRGVAYFLEPLVLLAPFAKRPINIALTGFTDGPRDLSVDYYRMCVLPLLKKLLPDNGLELKLQARGVWPEGAGKVLFSCPVVRKMKPLLLMDEGRVRRVRGVAHCVRVSPAMASRMVDSTRRVLNSYLPDVYIYTDVVRGKEGGRSPGFGLTLVAESTSGVTHSAESSTYSASRTLEEARSGDKVSKNKKRKRTVETDGEEEGSGNGVDKSREGKNMVLPEDIGSLTASRLLEEIVKGGCVDSCCQVVPLLFMALGQRDVSKIKLGALSPYTIQFLRHLKEFFQVTFKVETSTEDLKSDGDDDEGTLGGVASITRETVTLSCVGVGYSNFSRGIM